jgi:hypothetical protein
MRVSQQKPNENRMQQREIVEAYKAGRLFTSYLEGWLVYVSFLSGPCYTLRKPYPPPTRPAPLKKGNSQRDSSIQDKPAALSRFQ